jgi:hypothetical protein
MTLLDRVAGVLESHGIPHALVGAAALAAAGVSRSTFDIDLLVMDATVLRPNAWEPVRAAGASVDIREGDMDDPLRGVVRIELGAERPIDVIVGRHAWQARALERAISAGPGPRVVAPRDLVLLKLYAGGTQDLWDIRELLRHDSNFTLAGEVESDLRDMPEALRDTWTRVYSGNFNK